MKSTLKSFVSNDLLYSVVLVLLLVPVANAASSPAKPDCQTNVPIPWDQIGAKAGADYRGDGLTVASTASGARLHCVFQRLDGEATAEGLWLTSTVTNTMRDRFQVKAASLGRAKDFGVGVPDRTVESGNQVFRSDCGDTSPQPKTLPVAGKVSIAGQTVRFNRAGLTEEYSVSMDGVRQDFVVIQKPRGTGELRVNLAVSGAKLEQTAYGAQLVLPLSGRKIAYTRLHVTDAKGTELPAKIEVVKNFALRTPHSEFALAVVVNDANATYPVRIDPTFSDANWVSMGGIPGANDTVMAAVIDVSGNLYIGGYFTAVGNTIANNIAEWNGSTWLPLGSGMGGVNSYVNALAISGSTLYAGGYFSNAGGVAANRIAQWNGSSWSALNSGLNNTVYALAVSSGTLYVGGAFTTAGGNTANYIAQWNGSNWSALGSGMNSTVFALVVSGGTLYAGGAFTTAGGNAANYIAQWNGSSWSALNSGLNNTVYALAVSGGALYAGGGFTTAGSNAANYVAQWNGSSWSALGSGMDEYVFTLAVSGGTLYAGGDFQTAGGVTANWIAQWNGGNWSALGAGILGGPVYTLAVSGSTLYAGGDFTTSEYNGFGPAYSQFDDFDSIAKWDGNNWSMVGSALGGQMLDVYSEGPKISALAVLGNDVYAGGHFPMVGSITVNCIAKWNGSSWSALAGGVNGDVISLAVAGNVLYVGGDFTVATNSGGVAVVVNRIAQWNGSSWSALGSGVSVDSLNPNSFGIEGGCKVLALAVSGSDLYVGGQFTTAGGSPAWNIAKWSGSTWSGFGDGLIGPPSGVFSPGSPQSGNVSALAMSGGNLYAGGCFTNIGNLVGDPNHIASWNGSYWSVLGEGGYYGPVNALAVMGGDLYVGGYFLSYNDNSTNCVLKWNGSSCVGLGLAVDGGAYSLAVSGSTLYVGGKFKTIVSSGGATIAANYIAQWDGSNWSALGSGMDPGILYSVGNFQVGVFALAATSSDLYAGGLFMAAGGKVSGSVARAIIVHAPPIITTQPSSQSVAAGSSATFLVAVTGSAPLVYQWYKGATLLSNGGNVFGATSSTLTVSNIQFFDGAGYTVLITNNYGSVTSSVATLTVIPGTPTVTWTNPASITYGTALGASQLNASASVAGSFTYMPVSGWVLDAGNKALTNIFTPTDTASYNSVTSLVSLVVQTAPLTIIANNTNRTVGQPNPVFAATVAGFVNSDNISVNLTSPATTDSPAGSYPIVVSLNDPNNRLPNYTVTLINGTLTVLPLPAVSAGGGGGSFTNGQFKFSIAGTAGQKVAVQASTNLQTWMALQTNVLGAAPINIIDSGSANLSKRYYRVVVLPP
jgi:hypothetical protein